MAYKEIDGDLIELAKNAEFDVIAHGCNCFCTMGAGIAVAMKNEFYCDKFPMEDPKYRGDINKLGTIDYKKFSISINDPNVLTTIPRYHKITIVNAYTQYYYGRNHADGKKMPLDYEALKLCMRKINHIFNGLHIGLPKIGAGLAGGNWEVISYIIKTELKNCDVTIVNYNK